MKILSVITIAALAALLVSSSVVPLAFAATPDAPLAKLGAHAWKSGTDSGGNVYTFHHIKLTHPRAGDGQIVSSPYLAYLPWSTSWTQKKNNFHIVATDPNPSDPNFCSFEEFGTFTSATTASGTWDNLGCGGESGTFTMSSGGALVVIATTGGRPGAAS